MKRFLTPQGVIGFTLIVLIVGIGIFAPLVIPADMATKMKMTMRLKPPSIG